MKRSEERRGKKEGHIRFRKNQTEFESRSSFLWPYLEAFDGPVVSFEALIFTNVLDRENKHRTERRPHIPVLASPLQRLSQIVK